MAVNTKAVKRIPLLQADECEHALLQVLLLKAYWIRRHQEVPFYTLGLAAYLDDQSGSSFRRPYVHGELEQHNNLLLCYFLELYKKVATCLAELFSAPVCFNQKHLALPGFHIYEAHPAFAEPVAKIHRDLQFCHLFAETESMAPERVSSFTLPLAAPPESGLNLFDDSSELKTFEPYNTGELILHSGLERHQAVLNSVLQNEPRITLQGHGWRRGNNWILYW